MLCYLLVENVMILEATDFVVLLCSPAVVLLCSAPTGMKELLPCPLMNPLLWLRMNFLSVSISIVESIALAVHEFFVLISLSSFLSPQDL